MPDYLHQVGSDPDEGDLDGERSRIAEGWSEGIRSGERYGWGGGKADCVLGFDYSEKYAPTTGPALQMQIPGEVVRDSSFAKIKRWFDTHTGA